MILSLFLAATVAASAAAAPSAHPAPRASASPSSASATPSAPKLPAGHPRVAQPASRTPHGGLTGLFRPPADTTDEDSTVPRGTIRVELRDPLDHPLAHHAVDLGIMHQSIAKGESHAHRQAMTDDAGVAEFGSLDVGNDIAYRVTAQEQDATYAATPFRLPERRGMHVVLHVYPVMRELPHTVQIGARCILYFEVKDDRIQVQERIDLFNGTPAAWVPHDVIVRLPEGFTALTGVQQMSDIGVDPVSGKGARLHGTFVPGDNMVVFNWQLPYSGQASLDFDVGMPPAVRQAIVRAAAAPNMRLDVTGFQPAVSQVNDEGQRELATQKALGDNEPALRSVHVALDGLPTPGPSRLVATMLAALGIAAGLYVSSRGRTRPGVKAAAKRDRERILDEIDQLELARESGEVGPKTYERARRELVDELASLLSAAK